MSELRQRDGVQCGYRDVILPQLRKEDNIEQIPDPLMKQVFSEEDETREYHCNSCGAVIITEAETSATNCNFCGSAVVLGDRLTGELAPAKIIPFSISKEQAMKAFRKWCRGGLVTPSGFMTADRIKGITGLYVPFWLYDLHNEVEAHARATSEHVQIGRLRVYQNRLL